jgi:predicted dehydrogenase
MTKPNPFRVGIAGLGMGREHLYALRSLAEGYEVACVCDIDASRAQAIAQEEQVPAWTDSFEKLVAMDLDIISICTPSYLHTEQALAALAAGKHVILEKPAAGSLHEIDELESAMDRSGRLLMPVFQQRFGGGLQKLKYLVDLGLAGKPILATAETAWRRRGPYYATWHGQWQTELGGALATLGIHAHDQVSYILGPASSVMAHIATLVNPIETEDTAAISLRMQNGALASFSVTTGSAQETTRLRFCFSNLSAESNPTAYAPSREPWVFTGDTPEIDAQIQSALEDFQPQSESLAGQFQRFYASLTQAAPLPVTLQDAYRAVELLTAIYLSARTRQAVDLPIPPNHPYYSGWRNIP